MTCDNCERVQELYVEATENEQAAMVALKREQRAHSATKSILAQETKEHPKAADAQEVFDLWVRLLGKTSRMTFGPARQKPVFARLAEKAMSDSGSRKDDLLLAVEGMALMPFVSDNGRQAKPDGAERHDDLTLVCRDEKTVERFMGYVEAHGRRLLVQMVRVLEAWRPGCTLEWDSGFQAPCPRCESTDMLVLVARGADVALKCAVGCDPVEVRGVLRELAKPRLAEVA